MTVLSRQPHIISVFFCNRAESFLDMNIYAIFLYDVVYLPCENILVTVYLFKLLGAIIWSSRRNFTMWYYGGNYLAMENFLMLTIIAWNDSFKEYAKFQV